MARTKDESTPKPKKQRFAGIKQVTQAYKLTSKSDPRVGLIIAGVFLAVLAVFVLIGVLIDHPYYLTFVGLPFALLAALVVFGRRAERAAYASVEGQPGAPVAVMNSLKRGWTVTPGIAATPKQDIVHRAVGRPGIVLVGEGAPARVGALIAQERKKLGRVAPDAPVTDFQVGSGAGQMSLRDFQRSLTKLPKVLTTSQVGDTNRRLTAMASMGLQMPKGPLPKGMRPPRQMR